MRYPGAIGVFAAFLAVSAHAADAKKSCFALPEQKIYTDDPVAQVEQPLLTQNECEAIQRRGLQIQLLEIPQNEEDAMRLSLGSKDTGGMFYFKIPFSF